jgi:pilus assembly protein Flp/PilA
MGESVKSPGKIRRFCADEKGATAIEYGLICAIIACALIGIAATGGALDKMYNDKVASLIGAIGGGGGGDDEED